MKQSLIIAFVFLIQVTNAQDLVLSMQASIHQNQTHIDSIKVVNTENSSQFVLKNIGLYSTYAVNMNQQKK